MDVFEERGKLMRLIMGVLASAEVFEPEIKELAQDELLIRCQCGKGLVMKLAGKSYPGTYIGRCCCEKGWFLQDWPARLPF